MDLPLTLPQWLLATLVLIIGAIIQGGIGYGVALLGAPLLYLIHPQLIPAPMLIVGMALPLLILLREWQAVHPRDVAWALPGSFAGTAMAALVLGVVAEQVLGMLLGILVLLGVGLSLIRHMPDPRPHHLLGAAGLSSFMATITSIGGPPLALAFQNVTGPRLRGTLSAIFVPAGIVALTALAFLGRFSHTELLLGLALIPGIVMGFWISGYLVDYLDRRWLRPAVLLFSAVAGVAAIVHALI
ncbi:MULTISPECIES: sulfite exporter TauE/SafE family protein [unclassified Ectothiorhodospira]|uniref:sulfite exporter TauE/SafE family protein n=1 Tax=unclassified Ectothiorhodospira TaxID=2684909 RepID=UPI001EE8C4D1|nr:MULTISPECIES: sulfite exporter TauE/SafE family protein [unclassified Ectothiorhodospira]MCG5516537.1 sulfite exporter TauE/SafE family protein [Ectothiorhodospira sp. 9100]MCG5519264.1 sulfite exporter TauE/SafE family protein [Ectothiorhodospira sp. 9905]